MCLAYDYSTWLSNSRMFKYKTTTNTTTIVATDDGLNARGLIDDSASDAEKEAYGEENQSDTYLKITGGVVNVDAKTL